ncbi:Hydroxysteroid dehydrogenase-like protein 2 [Saguinus oedipus]|uniref:Hydroxysteroid dehydrogenase-like protein 2 n=1 Tax=Saguinus oedipus TaxID=9490 RepID=A0ABQ9WH96_SAGOE|nr:Hydroxysteroid dehydrogenase-like protein 2 [Saguinus oedipus]
MGAVPEFKEGKPQPQPKPRLGAVEETFRIVKDSLSDDVVKATQGIYLFELSGEDGGTWFLDLKSKGGNVGYGEPSNRADVVMSMSTDDFVKMFSAGLRYYVSNNTPIAGGTEPSSSNSLIETKSSCTLPTAS